MTEPDTEVARLRAALDEALAEIRLLTGERDSAREWHDSQVHRAEAAESALAVVRALADRFRDLAQQHMHGPRGNPSRAGAYAAAVREIEAALATPTATTEGSE